jgi:hypothetical protein
MATHALSPAEKAWATRRANGTAPQAKQQRKIKITPVAPIKMPKKQQAVTSQEIMMKTVVLILTINATGNRRKLDPRMLNVNNADDQQWINATKKLMDAEELAEITSLNNKTRQFVESLALPSYIKKGVYLLPLELMETLDNRLTEDVARLKPLVDRMIAKLPQYKTEAKQRLSHMNVGGKVQDMWDEEQFPVAEELRAAFRLHWSYKFIDSAKNIEAVSKEIYDREVKKAEAEWTETREMIQSLLRTNLSEMVNHMIDRLTPEADGRQKMFKENSVNKLNQFLATFDARNVTNDVQMKVLVDQAKSLVRDADAESLRSSDELRDHVRYGFETIKKLLDPMITIKGRRMITLPD